jgi:hypothetical protein
LTGVVGVSVLARGAYRNGRRVLGGSDTAVTASTARDFSAELSRSGDSGRRRLRRELGLVRGSSDEAHHIVPLGLADHELVQRAARSGFDINSAANGAALSFDRHRGINIFHHNRYNAAIRSRLDYNLRKNPTISDPEAAQLLHSYTQRLKRRLGETSGRLR